MDRGALANLLDREQKTLSDILSRYGGVMMAATTGVDGQSTVGSAAYNSMQMELELKGLVKSTEDLLTLTRLLRELWLVGSLLKPGEGERVAEQTIDGHVQSAAALMAHLRDQSRQQLVGPTGQYVAAPVVPPGPLPPVPEGVTTSNANEHAPPQQGHQQGHVANL
ncbi:hypothetical protein RB594_008067 [Gaeumannomyces avenae]